jgi:hypothetical protein
VKTDVATGDLHVLAGSSQGACQIMRFGGDLEREWTMPAPGSGPYAGGCKAVEVLPDGSALTLREYSLARIDRQGQTLWTVNNGDNGRSFQAGDLALDGNGVIWVAASGGIIGSGSNQSAAVLRFDLDGTPLSVDYFPCTTCIASFATLPCSGLRDDCSRRDTSSIRHIAAISASPNCEHFTSVAPSIRRAKS